VGIGGQVGGCDEQPPLHISAVTVGMVARIEDAIDQLVADHPLRPVFVVPGTTMASAGLDLARTVLRRAERRLVAYRQSGRDSNPHVLAYLNRAADLLYVLARHAAGDLEEPASHE
jgi:cob(I)alamin adenosyltransferase